MEYRERDLGEPDRQQRQTAAGDAAAERSEAEAASGTRRRSRILLAVLYDISAERIFLVAAGIAFYAILAIFPGVAAMVSIYGLYANPSSIAGHLDSLSGVAPAGAVDVLSGQLTHLTQQDPAALGFSFAVSLVVALWSANAGISGLFTGLNAVYEVREQRSLVRFYATTFAFTIGAIALVLLSLAVLVVLPLVLDRVPNAAVTAALVKLTRWPVLLCLAAAVLAAIYRYGPCHTVQPEWRRIAATSTAVGAAWLGASAIFSWYVANFGSYNKTYGSLGAIFGFMTWIWVSMVVILTGARLEAELARRLCR
jgi:membrane protein